MQDANLKLLYFPKLINQSQNLCLACHLSASQLNECTNDWVISIASREELIDQEILFV
jgi:hypothetical protein